MRRSHRACHRAGSQDQEDGVGGTAGRLAARASALCARHVVVVVV
jgi:hypothetical protein